MNQRKGEELPVKHPPARSGMSGRVLSSEARAQTRHLAYVRPHRLSGYLPGFRQPAVVLEIAVKGVSGKPDTSAVDRVFRENLPEYGRLLDALPVQFPESLRMFSAAAQAIMLLAGFLFFSRLLIVQPPARREGWDSFLVHLPCLGQDEAVLHELAHGLAELLGRSDDSSCGELADRLASLKKGLARGGLRGFNTSGLLRAADELGIPWSRVVNNVFQFGWGQRARWLDSTFTDETSRIGAALARNKLDTASILRRAGLPVSEHYLARDAEHAVALAERLGFPVVVKPATLDAGAGVAAGLRSADAVRKAFLAARELCPMVMVEKHFEGKDYRLQVCRGAVFQAVNRVPGGVMGDGATDIRRLLEMLNSDPQRGDPGSGTLLKRIHCDDEALEVLAEQGLSLQSVPEEGRFVRLRRTANLSTGGMPVSVLDKAHPDNLQLAVRAARALRLDVAGVDLLIDDIAVSWRVSGAVICEVNAQPQVAPRTAVELLARLVEGDGRIPVLMLIGDSASLPGLTALADGWAERIAGLGIAAPGRLRCDGELLDAPLDPLATVERLLLDTTVCGVVVLLDAAAIPLLPCLPVDRVDCVALVGQASSAPSVAALSGRFGEMFGQVWRIREAMPKPGEKGEPAGQWMSLEQLERAGYQMLEGAGK